MNGPEAPRPSKPSSRAWPIAAAVMVSGFCLTVILIAKSCEKVVEYGEKTIGHGAGALKSITEAFQVSVKTSYTFTSYSDHPKGNQYLQVATLGPRMERFERSDIQSYKLPFSTTSFDIFSALVSVSAPVTYTYYLDLKAPWTMLLTNNVLIVTPPPIRFNEPAVDVSRMTKKIDKSSVAWDEAAMLDLLQKQVMGMARARAREAVRSPEFRDVARRETEDFIRTWAARSFFDATNYTIKVVFQEDPRGMTLPSPRG